MEIMVAIGIFLLMITGVVALFSYSLKSNKIIWEQLKTQNEGRKVIQDFVNELREANYSSIGSYPIEQAGSSQIIFYTNIDSDTYRERIRYFLDDDTLKKGVTKPTSTPLVYNTSYEVVTDIVHDLANTSTTPIFSYYNQDYGSTSSTGALTQPVSIMQVRTVGISLEMEEDPTASPVPFHIESKVEIRNLKSN